MSVKFQPDPVDVHVGSRIRLRRNQLGISQSALADHLGLTFQQIQKYERGANRILASMMFRAAQKLDVKVVFFFEGLDGQSSDTGAGPADTIAMAAMLAVPEIELIPKLDRDHQRAVGKVLEAMAGGRAKQK